jgi:hypothetical protein
MVFTDLTRYYDSEVQTVQGTTDDTFPLDSPTDFVTSFLNTPSLVETLITLAQMDVERNDELIAYFDEIIEESRLYNDDNQTASPIPEPETVECNRCETLLNQIEFAVNNEPVCESCFNEAFEEANS